VVNAFTGKSRTWVLDAVFKWAPQGNTARQQLKIQGEYMRRKEDGDLTFDADGLALADVYESEQSGWYLQSVFQFRPRWRLGLRYDALDSGTPDIALVQSGLLPAEAFPVLLPADPERITVMLDWSPTEFSRLRAQYAWDDARATDDRDRQFFLQYLFGIGAHGAHKY
jgi:outer membrane receptor protein involved in Fe transport